MRNVLVMPTGRSAKISKRIPEKKATKKIHSLLFITTKQSKKMRVRGCVVKKPSISTTNDNVIQEISLIAIITRGKRISIRELIPDTLSLLEDLFIYPL